MLHVSSGSAQPAAFAGDRDHVRREEDREHGGVERRVGPVVPVPGLLVLRSPQRPEVGDPRLDQSSSACPPSAALGEHRPEYVGPVGHQAIDTTVQERLHLVGVVDGPDVHVHARPVRASYQTGGDDGQRPALVGDLEHARPPAGDAAGRRGRGAPGTPPPRRAMPRSRPGRRSGGGTGAADGRRTSRRRPGPRPRARRGTAPAARRRRRLEVDVEARVGEGVEELGQRGHAARSP